MVWVWVTVVALALGFGWVVLRATRGRERPTVQEGQAAANGAMASARGTAER
jgi:hypothetical protein